MSRGFGAHADLVQTDDTNILYKYCCYNVNLFHWKEDQKKEDGEILIPRNALFAPEIHTKRIRASSGRTVHVEKRILKDYSVSDLVDNEKVKVKNASGAWRVFQNGIDQMAYHLIYKLINEYQKTGEIPKHINWFV